MGTGSPCILRLLANAQTKLIRHQSILFRLHSTFGRFLIAEEFRREGKQKRNEVAIGC